MKDSSLYSLPDDPVWDGEFVDGIAHFPPALTTRVEWGALFRPGSLWIGAHYSKANRRWCINLLPMVTFWLCLKGGRRP